MQHERASSRLDRPEPQRTVRRILCTSLFAGGWVATPAAHGEDAPGPAVLEEVLVTARKRTENVQDVPVTIQSLSGESIRELGVRDFSGYAALLPSLTFESLGPGTNQVIIRGVSSNGGDPGLLRPTVATYFDEQPVSTIIGSIDVEIYDIARIEELAGPQGTLYGASSEAGTLRIITNKPDPSKFLAGYELEGNLVSHGEGGYVAHGFVNLPLTSAAAVRLVGWSKRESGYIDNVANERPYPASGTCIANFSPPPSGCFAGPVRAERHFNPQDTNGGRAALGIAIGDSWTVTPSAMVQERKSYGVYGWNLNQGDLQVSRYLPDLTRDQWVDAALTVQGKIFNFDLLYAGGFLNRDLSSQADYTDYAAAYDGAVAAYITDSNGKLIDPSIRLDSDHTYRSQSHELRLSTPQNLPVRAVIGGYYQRQAQHILQDYLISGLGSQLSVPGFPDTSFLTFLNRVDRDTAVFGEVYYDLLKSVTVTGGLRYFHAGTSLLGYFGGSSLASCLPGPGIPGAPCNNLGNRTSESGHTPKVELAWHVTDRHLLYASWSRGFRPGGTNLAQGAPSFRSDYLTNYEIGWKTSWLGDRLRVNGALFQEDWSNFQFRYTGAGGASVLANAGQARIRGGELEVSAVPGTGLSLSAGVTLLDPKLTENYCGTLAADGSAITDCPTPLAPRGTQLPGSPRVKGSLSARQTVPLRANLNAHLQASWSYHGSAWSDLRLVQRGILGQRGGYGVLNLAAGLDLGHLSAELFAANVLDRRGQVTRYTECGAQACAPYGLYAIPVTPRTIGLRFSQDF